MKYYASERARKAVRGRGNFEGELEGFINFARRVLHLLYAVSYL